MSTVVVASAALPFDVASVLGDNVHYRAPAAGWIGRDALLAQLADADALISLLRDRVDEALLAAAPKLRVVANCAVGYDNLDFTALRRRGIAATHTPDVLTDATADFAFALLLAVARRVVEGDALMRSGTWTGWEPGQLLGAPVADRTLGIIGMGRIGRAMARRARGFNMSVMYAVRPGSTESTRDDVARPVTLPELWETADFVSLHCPHTPETHHIVDAAALAAMQLHTILINTARGACMDEAALADALREKRIGGAGLDVFECEPNMVPWLRHCPRVVLAPHAGSATTEARARMAEMCVYAVRDVLAGRRPGPVVADLDGGLPPLEVV